MPNSEHAIVVEQLSKRYGALLAVDGVSFTVAKGEMFAFLGPNGAGKTTTAEIIETIRTPMSGRVTVLGMDVAKSKAKVVRRIGVLPQGFGSFDRDDLATLRMAGVAAVFAAIVFVAGTFKTRWDREA